MTQWLPHYTLRPFVLSFLVLTSIYLLIVRVQSCCCTWSHSHSVGLLWMRDRPDAEICTCTTHGTHKRQTSMPPAGFEWSDVKCSNVEWTDVIYVKWFSFEVMWSEVKWVNVEVLRDKSNMHIWVTLLRVLDCIVTILFCVCLVLWLF